MTAIRRRINLQAIADLTELADYSCAFALRAAAAIGVADHLAEGPLPVAELASRCDCHPQGLSRLLRALATKSVFAEVERGVFASTPLGELLQTDHPLSMRWFFRLQPDLQALAGLEYTVRTGKPYSEEHSGASYSDWLDRNPLHLERFRESGRSLTRLELLAITRAFPWSGVGSMVDVRGHDGAFVAGLLKSHPHMRGAVFDLPERTIAAADAFAQAGVTDRASIIAGDVLRGRVPAGVDLYSVKRVLVSLSDEDAVAVLRAIREAMRPESRLLILEPMRGGADRVAASLDLLMLVVGPGKVRTLDEFGALLAQAGLAQKRTVDAGLVTIIEAERAQQPAEAGGSHEKSKSWAAT